MQTKEQKAHWVVKYYGINGVMCICSNCRESYHDLFGDIISKNKCPKCNIDIDKDVIDYSNPTENTPDILSIL